MEPKLTNFNFLKKWHENDFFEEVLKFESNFLNYDDTKFNTEIGKVLEEALYLTQDKFVSSIRETTIATNFYAIVNFIKDEGNQVPGGVKSAVEKFKFKRNISVHSATKEEKEYLIIEPLTIDLKLSAIQELHLILAYLNNTLWSRQFSVEKINIKTSYSNQIYLPESQEGIEANEFEEAKVSNQADYLPDDYSIGLSKESIGTLLVSNYEFVIPPYQRKYSWETANIVELLSSIHFNVEKTNATSEYFGTIAVTSNASEKSVNTVRLIDGQQRLTSSLLIAKAIYDIFKEDIKNFSGEFPDELDKLFKQNVWKNKIKNATNLEKEHHALAIILDSTRTRTEKNYELKNYKKTNVNNNYVQITTIINGYLANNENKEEYLVKLWSAFANNFHLAVINFKKSKEEEMRIFENLNSKGMELSTFELIKNSIFLKVESSEFENYENEISKYFNSKIDFSNKDVIAHSPKIKDVHKCEENFIYNFLTFKKRDENEISKTSKNLLLAFNNVYMKNYKNISFDQYKNIIDELSGYVSLYLSVITEEYKGSTTHYLNTFENYLDIFNFKDALMPFMFYLMEVYGNWNRITNEYEIDSKYHRYIKETILEIEKWSISLNQITQGKSLKGVILGLIRYLDFIEANDKSVNFKENLALRTRKWLAGKEDPNESNIKIGVSFKTPTKEQFKDQLSNSGRFYKKDDAMLLLKRIEQNIIDPKLTGSVNLIFKNPSLEHIFPQNPLKNSKWYKTIKERKPNTFKNDEDVKEYFENYINRIGNYLWLDIKSNSALQNKDFEIKKNEYVNSRTAKDLKFKDVNNKEVTLFSDIDFSIEEIKNRSEAMATIIVNEIYKYD
ncbi:DUF262 domain-containing protein [Mesoplasma seiffertii]|uniref:DUF262 domain-containing protein n=1 Tax=Mesoplasma seiffertii TaxID=28224 RepID=UPI00047A1723|nr:DUF262 domain-containing protein [Mesoplasma seiffertii]